MIWSLYFILNSIRSILVWPLIRCRSSYSLISQDIDMAAKYGKPGIPELKFKSAFDRFNKIVSKDKSISNIIFF